jgi:hypothetical protein
MLIPHAYASPAESEDEAQQGDSQIHFDDEELTAVPHVIDQFCSTAEPNTKSTQIITGPHLSSIELSRAAQKSEAQSSSSSTDEDASKCNFQINASRPMGNKSDLASEQLDEPDITDEPIPLDLPRSVDASCMCASEINN